MSDPPTRNGFVLPRILVPKLAERIGISRATIRTEIRRGNWVPLLRGVVLTRPEEPKRTDWAEVGLAAGGPSAALTGWDALRLKRLAPPVPPSDRVVVLTRTGHSRTLGSVHIRRTDRPFRTWTTSPMDERLPAARVADPARAVADAGLEYRDLSAVRSLVASAVQRRGCRLDEIAVALNDGPRRSSAPLRQALHDLGTGARSEAEVRAARQLARAAVPAFELNVPVVDGAGRLLYIVDVLWRALRAALEVDSRECHFSDADWQQTLRRHNDLTRWGLAITHYPPSRIARRGDSWLTEVAEWLERRARDLGVESSGCGMIPPPAGAAPAPLVVHTGGTGRSTARSGRISTISRS